MPEVNPLNIPVGADLTPLARQLRAAADLLDPPAPGKVTIEIDADVRDWWSNGVNMDGGVPAEAADTDVIAAIIDACRASRDAEQ